MTNGTENTTGTDMVLVPRALLLQAQEALRGCAGPDEIRNAQRDLGETIRKLNTKNLPCPDCGEMGYVDGTGETCTTCNGQGFLSRAP